MQTLKVYYQYVIIQEDIKNFEKGVRLWKNIILY